MSIIAKTKNFVKKLFTIILAMIMVTAVGIPMDLSLENKAIVWSNGYSSRCRNYGAHHSRRNHNAAKRMAKRVLLAPLALFIGVANAEQNVSCIGHGRFLVEYEKDNNIAQKRFVKFEDAKSAYEQIRRNRPTMPARISNLTTRCPIILGSHNWGDKMIRKQEVKKFFEEVELRLYNAMVKRPQVDAVMKIRASELRRMVATRDIEGLCEVPGIGEKTAEKICFALKSLCRPEAIKIIGTQEFTRVTLNNDFGEQMFTTDIIKKTVSPVEAEAIALGGKDAIIHVTSYIKDPNPWNIDEINRAEELSEFWEDICYKGLILNDKKYVVLGHGTNAAKECRSLWVLESIYDKMAEDLSANTNKNWVVTAAKKFAYIVGLQAVPRKSVGIPFIGEDFAILPSVYSKVITNVTKEYLDGHEQDIDNYELNVNRSDGYFIIDIPDNKIHELLNRMILRGESPEDAEEKLKAFMADHSVNSYRVNGAAIKGLGDKRVKAHEYLWSKGITKTPDGRDIKDICIFADASVLKTQIGPNKAYNTFEDWCDAVRDKFDLGICVKGHSKKLKDTSYQVVQCLCEATRDTVEKLAQKTINLVNDAHTVEGASKLLSKEQGNIMRIFPEIANVRDINERIVNKLTNLINDAFSGRLLRNSFYAFVTPDPFYILNGWFGLPLEGCLKANEFSVPGVRCGKLASWRSPVMHPNSVRVVNNVLIGAEYRKYMDCRTFCITMNSVDDISTAQDLDWDGDHGSVSDDDNLIAAAEQTLKVWNRLIIWETPASNPGVVGRKEELRYMAKLTKTNELGLMVYGLNALLNRVIKYKNKVTKETEFKVIDISKRGVNFKKFVANVLVDAGKHGGSTVDEPDESSICTRMLQPWAKDYRDAVEDGQIWRVVSSDDVRCFKTEDEAKSYVEEERRKPLVPGESVRNYKIENNLDMLADISDENIDLSASTLNQIFVLYAKNIDRKTKLYDVPMKQFDVTKLMYNPGNTKGPDFCGLFRKGEMPYTTLNGIAMRPDQGLFNALCRRYQYDVIASLNDESKKDDEDNYLNISYRDMALSEIEKFAESIGKTLEDAYDFITYKMFTSVDREYATTDNKLDFLRDCLWSGYWTIFGGMAEEAAKRYADEET